MKILARLLMFGLLFGLLAQVAIGVTPSAPRVINYQGRLTDLSGNPISDGPHGARFMIWRDSTSNNPGDIVWDSGPLTVVTDKGLFTVRLGAPPQPVLDPVNMQDSLRFLGITVGADPEIAPRTRLTSVPYAFTAEHAHTAVTAGSAYGLDPSVAPAGATLNFFLNATGSTTAATLGQFTVNAPGAGYLIVNVSGTMFINADATSANALTTYYYLGLCTAPNSSACGSTYQNFWVTDPDNTEGTNQTPAYSINSTFQVFAAGPQVFYINGATSNVAYTLSPWGYTMVNVIFTPNTLTITSPAPSTPGTELMKQQRQ